MRYIHLNPLRDWQVSSLEELAGYFWCGHGHLLEKRVTEWQVSSEILEHFSRKLPIARQCYARFVADGVKQGKRPDLIGGGLIRSVGGRKGLKKQASEGAHQKSDERILGDGDFVEATLAQAQESLPPQPHFGKQGVTFDVLVE
ncbi:MAG: hypothetical protein P8X63_06015 [Desulfuromonadaceae bacterium]